MKGVVLAGGNGTRLWPLTHSISKQLLPVYDKPMIYYPLSTLMLAGIKEILVITKPDDLNLYQNLLGDGSRFGINLNFAVQKEPRGIAESVVIAEKFLANDSFVLILGDNFFHGPGLGTNLHQLFSQTGSQIFAFEVGETSKYGILELHDDGTPNRVVEKPIATESRLAVTGMYFFDHKATELVHKIKPSFRNELEITDLINMYIELQELKFEILNRSTAWFDMGTIEDFHETSNFVKAMQLRTGRLIACPEQIAYQHNWIAKKDIQYAVNFGSSYSNFLREL